MSNKIRVLTNISASQNVIVSGSTVISGSKLLATTSSFNNSSIVTSSDGFYNMNSAIHGLDTGITTLKNNIKTAYNSIRAVLTGALDSSGNKKINLTSTIPSGSLYFTTASLTSVGASLLIDTESDNAYKNDLVSFQLFNSASYLWAEIDAPAATNDYYRLIVVNHGSLPIGGNANGGGNGQQNNGGGGQQGGGGENNLVIIFAPITSPTGSVDESVSGAHEGYYIYSDVSGNVTITINDFSASTSDGGISFYAVSNNYTGSITYDDTTDVITSNEFEKVITITGDVNTTAYNAPQENTLEPVLFANPSGQEGYNIIMPNLTSSIINDGNNITVTIPVGTGSSVYVDTYSNTTPTTYDFNWSGGIYNNSGSDVSRYIPTYVTGGYWVGSGAGNNNDFANAVTTIATSSQGFFRGTNNASSMVIIKSPSTLNGQTVSNVVVRWYGGGPVAVSRAWDLNNQNIGFYWNQYGTWDTGYANFKQITSFFVSADYVAGVNYSANRNLATEPIVTYLGSAPLGKDGPGEGHIVVVSKGYSIIEWEYIYS